MATSRRQRPRVASTIHISVPSNADISEESRYAFLTKIAETQDKRVEVVICHPTAGSKTGRAKLAATLRAWGVPPELVVTFGWALKNPNAQPPPAKEGEVSEVSEAAEAASTTTERVKGRRAKAEPEPVVHGLEPS